MANQQFGNSRSAQSRRGEKLDSAEALERMKIVVEAFERGLDAKDGAFYHGTSWEALEASLAAGALPPGLGGDCGPAIYFAPKPSMFSIENPKCELPASDEEALDMGKEYAQTIAPQHALITKLGWNYASPVDQSLADAILRELPFFSFDGLEHRDLLLDRGINKNTALALRREFSDCDSKGVVLMFSLRLSQAFQIQEAAPKDDGVRILTSSGIPLEYLVGIEPIGAQAYDNLERMQRRFYALREQ